MDEGQARNPNTTYNGYIMEFWKFALTWKLICPVQHKITQKEQKETTKEGGISLTIMGQRSIYNSIHNPSGHRMKRLGLIRMTTHTECAMKQEFLSRNSYGRDGDVTCALTAQSYPTRFYQRAHPTYIYIQILKNPPEYTMRYSVQPGRNTKNEAHAHLLGNA